MSLLEDLFGEDDLLGDPGDLETIEENADENIEANNDDENTEQQTGTKVEVKKRIVRNPQPKLNADRLRGPRGIAVLESVFQNVKFKGKGHEKEDLKKVMWKLEHWCHRLYPKFQFDDCLERIEKLGSKKVVQTYVKKIRMGIVDVEDDTPVGQGQEDDAEVLPPADEFDQLLDQQINEINVPVVSQISQTPLIITKEMQERMERNRQLAQQKLLAKRLAEEQQLKDYEATLDVIEQENLNPNTNQESSSNTETIMESTTNYNNDSQIIELSDEQKERIERNRQLALQKRLERMKKLEEQKLIENSQNSTVNLDS
ncbi:TIMELESS-interacting protein [Chrysoperla carnea]|uniref:TIMELESS-interacting protein n=1 Tax=Chrysoperla carnea TaxID=189513 RepID=UPI001D083DD8|nr:TIMELESS-interacting protein [Chrysoperla carnea]